jgi:hypothetical protein
LIYYDWIIVTTKNMLICPLSRSDQSADAYKALGAKYSLCTRRTLEQYALFSGVDPHIPWDDGTQYSESKIREGTKSVQTEEDKHGVSVRKEASVSGAGFLSTIITHAVVERAENVIVFFACLAVLYTIATKVCGVNFRTLGAKHDPSFKV